MSLLEINRFQTLLQSLSSRISVLERYASAGRWISFTPVIGNGWSIGNGTAEGEYVRHGNFVTFWSRFTFGAVGSVFGATRPSTTWPVTADANITKRAGTFHAQVYDGARTWLLHVDPFSTTSCQLWAQRTVVAAFAVSTYVDIISVSSTAPLTWAVGNVLTVTGTYKAAE